VNGEDLLLIDPEWLDQDDQDDQEPPAEAIVGWWPAGGTGPFHPNPGYRPLFENSPADPLEAVIRLALVGEAEMDQVRTMLRDSLVELALNGDGRPLLLPSPDGPLCAVAATSTSHRERMFSPAWRQVALIELLALLPADADLLLNPGGPSWSRFTGDFVREAAR